MNYDSALSEYQKVLSLSPPNPLEDEALFNMGIIYAHFGNPKRDYQKSLNLFLKILNDFHESPLIEQSKIWVGILIEKMGSDKKIEKLKETIKELEKAKQLEGKSEDYWENREHLIRSQKLLAQGNYEGAIAENQKALSQPDSKSSKDEALFNLGLIYAHFGNPQKDIGKSLEYFKRLIKNYPKSPFIEQVKILVGILEENEELNHLIQKLKEVDIDIEEMKRKEKQ
jgi:tetratricopeptide (TPR) repeat protein